MRRCIFTLFLIWSLQNNKNNQTNSIPQSWISSPYDRLLIVSIKTHCKNTFLLTHSLKAQCKLYLLHKNGINRPVRSGEGKHQSFGVFFSQHVELVTNYIEALSSYRPLSFYRTGTNKEKETWSRRVYCTIKAHKYLLHVQEKKKER